MNDYLYLLNSGAGGKQFAPIYQFARQKKVLHSNEFRQCNLEQRCNREELIGK